MLNQDNLKIVRWFEAAKKIVSDNQDIPIVFSNKEFVDYVNYRVEPDIKISKSYIDQIIFYNPETSTLPESTEATFGNEFRTWFSEQKKEQELKLYKQMMMRGETQWPKFDNVLNKRFGKKWVKSEHQTVDSTVAGKIDHNVIINFKEKK